jgi:hypothetical protein
MDLMILNRPPTQNDLDKNQIDLEGFYEAFENNRVHGFVAKAKVRGDYVELDGYSIEAADWFSVAKG